MTRRFILGILAPLAPLVFAGSGCFDHYVDCDGDECDYSDAPSRYETRERYVDRGETVYEVDGRYYRQYGPDRRWVAYRKPPRHLRRPGPVPIPTPRPDPGPRHDDGPRPHDGPSVRDPDDGSVRPLPVPHR